jgi:hypothetical protein
LYKYITRVFFTAGLAVQNNALKDDILKYIAQINELGERLSDIKENVEVLHVNMDAMKQGRKQLNQAHMKECLAREEAQKERERLEEEIKSLRDHCEDERKFTEKLVLQSERDYQTLQNTLDACESDKKTFMKKNKQLTLQNKQYKRLVEARELNSELDELILKENEELEALTKADQSKRNSGGATGGIQSEDKRLGLRGVALCKGKTVAGQRRAEKDLHPGGLKGKTLKSTGGGLWKGKSVETTFSDRKGKPGGLKGGAKSKDRMVDSTRGGKKPMVKSAGTGAESRRKTAGLAGVDSEYKPILSRCTFLMPWGKTQGP